MRIDMLRGEIRRGSFYSLGYSRRNGARSFCDLLCYAGRGRLFILLDLALLRLKHPGETGRAQYQDRYYGYDQA